MSRSRKNPPGRKRKRNDLNDNGGNPCVEKKRVTCRRYRQFHDNFLNYDKILLFLNEAKKENPERVDLVLIGHSGGGKPILMATVTAPGQNPKMGVMVEAGLNGKDYMAVSNALYIIDYLANNPSCCTLMNYHIIPCSNPDAYDSFLSSRESRPRDLSRNFPIVLGLSDMRAIPTDVFLDKIKSWKQNYKVGATESQAVLRAIYAYQFELKLFVSLQGGCPKICHPYGAHGASSSDVNELREVARKGKCAIDKRCFEYGSVYDLLGLTYGTIVDFLRIDSTSLKFSYIIQVGETNGNVKNESKLILNYGEDMTKCVKAMATAIYKFYNKPDRSKNKIETRVSHFAHRK